MKAYVSYTILDTIEMDFDGTLEEFEEAILFDASDVAAEITKHIGLEVNDINVDVEE